MDERRHPATETRLREARREGRVPLSPELANGLFWLGAVAVLSSFAAVIWQQLQKAAVKSWTEVNSINAASLSFDDGLAGFGTFAFNSIVPLLVALAGIAVIATGLQTRFGFFSLRPGDEGTRARSEIASPLVWMSAAWGPLKLLLLALIGWWVVAGDLPGLLRLSGMPLDTGLAESADWMSALLIKLCGATCAVGLVDYGVRQLWHRRQMQMTDEELREERRATEAPREITARRRLDSRRRQ